MAHIPVLLEAVLEALKPSAGCLFLDATFGGGGHTRALLEAAQGVTVVALDEDPEAQERSEALKPFYGERFQFYSMNFEELETLQEGPFDGILFDLGVSSFQLDTPQRGFSFRFSGALDMRMNPHAGMSVATFLKTARREALEEAIRDFGEEPQWKRVVRGLLEAREKTPIQDTLKLAALVCEILRCQPHPGRTHPATRTFQGLRIAVNRELEVLHRALPQALEKLKPGGILAVISFHSLEDRIVKRAFKRFAGLPEHRGDGIPMQERLPGLGRVWKDVAPTTQECERNPRSRSARLRIFQKN